MKLKNSAIIFFGLFALFSSAQKKTDLLIRLDDVGMSHSVNSGVRDVIKTGIPVNVSVMVPCPWFSEAVEMLNKAPQVSVGLHLTLTSEFDQYKWGPVAPKDQVSSLLEDQKTGYFRASVSGFLLSDYDLVEVEIELRAQIEKALAAGLNVTYLDHHMGIARSTPEIAAILEKLAGEYHLVISRYFDEQVDDLFAYPLAEKKRVLLEKTKQMKGNGKLNMFVMHIGENHPELDVLIDENSDLMYDAQRHKSVMGENRDAELKALISPEFLELTKDLNLLTYKDLIKRDGADAQRRNGILYESMDAARAFFLNLKKQKKDKAYQYLKNK